MTRKLRLGVIGCGGIAARRTIPETVRFVQDAEIVSVMDTSRDRAEQVARDFSILHWCTDERALLDREVDAVYIASPPSAHCQQMTLAAGSGKHVLCEKPMALSAAEVDAMATACRPETKFMLGFCMRFNLNNRKARELVHSGALGKPVMGRAQLTCWYPPIPGAWRQDLRAGGGGSFLDMGTHCVDLLEWIMGSRVTEVVAFQDQLVQKYPTPVEDTSTVLLRFRNGAHGVVDNFFNVPDAASPNALELYGSSGSMQARGTIGQSPGGTLRVIRERQADYEAAQVRENAREEEEIRLESTGIYAAMIQSFVASILDDTPTPIGLDDGRHSVELADAVYRSARGHRIVKLD